jgi:hypothetical protein
MSDDLTIPAAVRAFAFGTGQATPAPATPAPTTPTAQPAPAHSSPGPQAEITAAQAAQIVRDVREDVAKGRITPEEATKRFDSLNASLEERMPDRRTTAEIELDLAFPSARPHEYHISYFKPGVHGEMTEGLTAFDASARDWLSTAGLPVNLGNALVDTIAKVVQTTHTMKPQQLDAYVLLENEKLAAAYGDTLDAQLETARQMVQALEKKTPGLCDLLKSRGIGDNALVVSQLIQAARIYDARKGR